MRERDDNSLCGISLHRFIMTGFIGLASMKNYQLLSDLTDRPYSDPEISDTNGTPCTSGIHSSKGCSSRALPTDPTRLQLHRTEPSTHRERVLTDITAATPHYVRRVERSEHAPCLTGVDEEQQLVVASLLSHLFERIS